MSLNEDKMRKSADATSTVVPSTSTLLEEKHNFKTDTVGDDNTTDASKSEHPQGWKLWFIYIATLLTMFLVGFVSIVRS